jgi:ribosomal protein L11 methyltransferase
LWSLLFAQFDDELIATLWEAGTVGLFEQPAGLRAYFDSERKPSDLAHLDGEFRYEEDSDVKSTAEDWEPIPIGQGLMIVPASFRGVAPAGRLVLPLATGAAFGTGRHETTQLCLEALERYLERGSSVLDVGCGSGILSVAASALGAHTVISCDIDEQAVDVTRRHLQTPVFRGSADAIAAQSFDLVVANLTAPILDHLAWDLQRVTRPAGMLLVTGFLRERPPASFQPECEFEREDWLCWLCRPEKITSARSAEPLTHQPEWWLSS